MMGTCGVYVALCIRLAAKVDRGDKGIHCTRYVTFTFNHENSITRKRKGSPCSEINARQLCENSRQIHYREF